MSFSTDPSAYEGSTPPQIRGHSPSVPQNQPPSGVARSRPSAFRRWLWPTVSVCIVLLVGFFGIAMVLSVIVNTVPRGGTGSSFNLVTKPQLPVRVTVRKAALGEGYVLNFANDGERHLKFDVTHERQTLNQASTFSVRLDPGRSNEVGWAEGYTFYPGDTVLLSHPDFESKRWVVNP